jgi:hypothetical protein
MIHPLRGQRGDPVRDVSGDNITAAEVFAEQAAGEFGELIDWHPAERVAGVWGPGAHQRPPRAVTVAVAVARIGMVSMQT